MSVQTKYGYQEQVRDNVSRLPVAVYIMGKSPRLGDGKSQLHEQKP